MDGELRNKGLNNGTTITENGGAPVYENGKTGLSLVCNGSKNWRISGVTLGTNVTIAWWSKTTVNGKMSWVLESDASAILNFFESNIYTLNVGDSNNNPFKTSANANINVLHDGKWHHFAVVFDANSVLLYIDGEYKGKATTYRSPASTNKILKLAGDFQRAHSYDWNGSLSDFRVYDDTLTAQDVRELYFGKILEVTPQWRDADRIHDASGFNFPLTPHNLTITGNTMLFNGTSSYIEFNGLNLKSGGTVSIWANLPAKPNVQRIYYCDPSSKMIIGYLAGGTILTAANSVSKPSYQSTGITWKNMHHIVAVYGNDRNPSALYVNGVQPATGTSSVWTNSGEIASIGRRIGSGGADYLSGSVNEVKVFSTQLTASEAKDLYKKGPCGNDWGHRANIQRLEYIESTGTQYIDTGYIPKSNTEIIIDAELTQAEANVTMAGSHYLANASTISKRFHVGTYQSKWHFGVGNNSSWYNFPSPAPDTKRHIFRILADGNCYVDDKTHKLSPGTTVSDVSVGLFCVHGYIPSSNTHSYYQNAKAKIYRVTMKEGGVVVMDLVPVYCNGECYLLDLVSYEMKGNDGTGSFLGAAIPAV